MMMQLIELKEQVDKIKEQLHGNVVDISTLKMQRNDMKLFGMDTSVAFALFVGVVLGILGTAMWKPM
jgi:hypothetical protein